MGMTTAYSPAGAYLAEDLRDSAITQLATALETLRIAREKHLDNWNADDVDELIANVHAATQSALAVAQIVVRRHQLAISV